MSLEFNVILIHLHGQICPWMNDIFTWMNFIYDLDQINKLLDEIHP